MKLRRFKLILASRAGWRVHTAAGFSSPWTFWYEVSVHKDGRKYSVTDELSHKVSRNAAARAMDAAIQGLNVLAGTVEIAREDQEGCAGKLREDDGRPAKRVARRKSGI